MTSSSWRLGVRACTLAGVVLVLSTAAHAAADKKPPIPVETFFQHPALLDVQLSPSGRYLATTSVRDNKRVGLLVVDLQTTEPARVVANFRKQDVVSFQWVNDGRLLYSLGQIEPARTTTHIAGLFSVDVEGKNHVELICSELKTCFQQTGSLGYNYRLLSAPRAQAGVKPDEVIVGKMDGALNQVVPYWLDVTSGIARRVDMPEAPKQVQAWWFNSRGEPRLAMSIESNADRGTYYWLAPGADKWRELASFKLLETPFEPFAVSDDGQLYVTQERGPAREAVLTTYDFEAGRPAAKAMVQTPGFDFSGYLLEEARGTGVLGVHVDADSGISVWMDPAMKRFQAEADQHFPGEVNDIVCRRCGQPDMVALVHSYSDRDPGRYSLYRAQTQRWESVAITMPGVNPQQMAAVDFQRIRARDGREIPVWLTLPSGVAPGKPAPAVVLPHGGPWLRGGHWTWNPMAQFLASRGYLVIEPEFRGSNGYGRTHFEAGFRQWGLSMQDDLADALLWARKEGLASDRACIAGASYGGYATLMGLVRHPDLYRCGVAWVAVADLMLYLGGSMWVSDDIGSWSRRHILPTLVGDPSKDAAALTAVSPVAQAASIRAPLMLAYGEDDIRVPPKHGTALRDALIKAGHPPEWVLYPNEGHGWQHTETRVDFAKRVEVFLDKNLKQP